MKKNYCHNFGKIGPTDCLNVTHALSIYSISLYIPSIWAYNDSATSVTRFGEISALGENLKKVIDHFLRNIWPNCEPTLANIFAVGHCSKWPNIEQII